MRSVVRTLVLVGAALLFLSLAVTAGSSALEAIAGPSLWAGLKAVGYGAIAIKLWPWLERRAVPSCGS